MDRGLWEVAISLNDDEFHDPRTVLLALREAQYTQRNMSHEEVRAATVEALAMLPCSRPEFTRQTAP